jgi:transposase-like protein
VKTEEQISSDAKNLLDFHKNKVGIYRKILRLLNEDSEPVMLDDDFERNLDWLMCNEDWKDLVDDNIDWAWEFLNDNGITSPETATSVFAAERFEYGIDDQPDCPWCGRVDKHYVLTGGQWKCKNCGKKFSLTSQTAIDNTKIPLYKWFRFCYLLGDIGLTNSSAIARDLKITQDTAWNMIETVRKARKEQSEDKFKTGTEVLSFKSRYNVWEILLSRKDEPEYNFPTNDIKDADNDDRYMPGTTAVIVEPRIVNCANPKCGKEINLTAKEIPGKILYRNTSDGGYCCNDKCYGKWYYYKNKDKPKITLPSNNEATPDKDIKQKVEIPSNEKSIEELLDANEICALCNKPLDKTSQVKITDGKGNEFCCYEHMASFQNITVAPEFSTSSKCPECGKGFEKENDKQKYCSHDCSEAHYHKTIAKLVAETPAIMKVKRPDKIDR